VGRDEGNIKIQKGVLASRFLCFFELCACAAIVTLCLLRFWGSTFVTTVLFDYHTRFSLCLVLGLEARGEQKSSRVRVLGLVYNR
jgi:hypothetical protein